jgi:hypothetical protein
VASGISQRLYDWRIHSYPAGYRNCRCFDQNHSGEKPFVTDTDASNYRGIDTDVREWAAKQQAAMEPKGGNMNTDHVYPLQPVAFLIDGLILFSPRLLNHITAIIPLIIIGIIGLLH